MTSPTTAHTADPAAAPRPQTGANTPSALHTHALCAEALSTPQDDAEITLPAAASADEQGASVLHLVDFKWLMAGEGHRIDLSRLQQDRAYARGCIALANASTCSALRDAGERMSRLLRVVAPRV